MEPLIGNGKSTLGEADWDGLRGKLSAYEAWAATKPVTAVEKLGLARVREILLGKAMANIGVLIQQDAALEAENARIVEV